MRGRSSESRGTKGRGKVRVYQIAGRISFFRLRLANCSLASITRHSCQGDGSVFPKISRKDAYVREPNKTHCHRAFTGFANHPKTLTAIAR